MDREEWIEKMRYVTHTQIHIHTHTHTHHGILLSHTKEGNFAIYSNMDGLGGHYTNNSDRNKYMLLIYMWNLILQQASEYNKKETTLTDI